MKRKRYILLATLFWFLGLSVGVAQEKKHRLNYPESTAEDVLAQFAFRFDDKLLFLFRDQKEMKRKLSVVSRGPLSIAEGLGLLQLEFRFEGLEISEISEGVYEVTKVLDDKGVAQLNSDGGREWKGPRYSTDLRIQRASPNVRFQRKTKKSEFAREDPT